MDKEAVMFIRHLRDTIEYELSVDEKTTFAYCERLCSNQ